MVRLASLVIAFAILGTPGPTFAQSAPAVPPTGDQTQIVKNTESFVRDQSTSEPSL